MVLEIVIWQINWENKNKIKLKVSLLTLSVESQSYFKATNIGGTSCLHQRHREGNMSAAQQQLQFFAIVSALDTLCNSPAVHNVFTRVIALVLRSVCSYISKSKETRFYAWWNTLSRSYICRHTWSMSCFIANVGSSCSGSICLGQHMCWYQGSVDLISLNLFDLYNRPHFLPHHDHNTYLRQ